MKKCRCCGKYLRLNINWAISNKKTGQRICSKCSTEYRNKYRTKDNDDLYIYNYNHSIKGIFRNYKSNAKKRNYQFELSIIDLGSLISSPCYYCGELQETFNGVDRINNNKGYVLSNCVSCCNICNHMKWVLTKEKFLGQIKKITEKHGGK